jgi:hypothetical protein
MVAEVVEKYVLAEVTREETVIDVYLLEWCKKDCPYPCQ